MGLIYIKIAEESFSIETNRQEAVLSQMSNYHPFIIEKPDEQDNLFSVNIDTHITLPQQKPIKEFRYDIADDSATLFIFDNRYILSILNKTSGNTYSIDCPMNCQADGDRHNFKSNLATHNTIPSRHITDSLLIFAYSIAALTSDTLLIHASTIVHQGKAVMFLAESGTGKSTHSQLWLKNIAGVSLLNDDAPALRVSNDGSVFAYGTPWSGKTACYKNECYPLTALVRIERAKYNRITRQSNIKALGALLPSTMPLLQQTDATLDLLCNTISKTITLTPAYIMECLPDAEAARVCHHVVFAGQDNE